MKTMEDEEMKEVTAREGFNINMNLDMSIGSIEIDDGDDYGTLVLDQIDLGTYDGTSWSTASLDGTTIDVDGTNTLQIGLPSGELDLDVDGVEPGASSTIMGIHASNLNFNSSAVRVSPN